MRIKINREQPFQVLATNFSIGPSSSGYDLQISADGINFTTLFSVGANVTRMVTGVANGSTYRLAGNTDEDVIVNWFRQCDDGGSGGGSGAQGPEGPQGAQGATGAQGPQGEAAQGGGDAHTLLSVSDLNDSSLDAAEGGDVRAKYIQNSEIVSTGGTVESTGQTFPSDGSLAVKSVDELDSIDGLRWKNGPDVFEMNVSGDGLVATLISGDGSRTASEVTATTTGTISGGDFQMEYKDGGGDTIIAFENLGKYWSCYSYSDSMQDYIFIYVPFEAQWMGSEVQNSKESDGVWQYKENPEWGRWFGGNSLPCGDDNYGGTFLVYDYLPFTSPTKICKLSRNASDNGRYLFYVNDHFATYTSENPDFDSPVDEIYAGVEVTITNVGIGNYKIYWDSSKKFLRFTANYNGVWEAINTSLSGYGWEAVEKNETIEFKTSDKTINGIPKWTKDGKIIGREVGYNAKTFYLNTNGYTNNLTVLTNGQNGGSYGRMFFPTVGGSAGQVLTSAGDSAEPTWATLIKSVKITSDAYEALEVKDPNTLYLIVDDE